jgi:hypothetical protein
MRDNTLAQELLALKNDNGLINPSDAVTWARRNHNSRLHHALEWDDDVAGEKWRIAQVRQLIAINIVDAEGMRGTVSLSIDRRNDGNNGYRPMDDVIAREDLRSIMMADALAELERVQARYAKLTELQEVWEAADKVRTRKRGRKAA